MDLPPLQQIFDLNTSKLISLLSKDIPQYLKELELHSISNREEIYTKDQLNEYIELIKSELDERQTTYEWIESQISNQNVENQSNNKLQNDKKKIIEKPFKNEYNENSKSKDDNIQQNTQYNIPLNTIKDLNQMKDTTQKFNTIQNASFHNIGQENALKASNLNTFHENDSFEYKQKQNLKIHTPSQENKFIHEPVYESNQFNNEYITTLERRQAQQNQQYKQYQQKLSLTPQSSKRLSISSSQTSPTNNGKIEKKLKYKIHKDVYENPIDDLPKSKLTDELNRIVQPKVNSKVSKITYISNSSTSGGFLIQNPNKQKRDLLFKKLKKLEEKRKTESKPKKLVRTTQPQLLKTIKRKPEIKKISKERYISEENNSINLERKSLEDSFKKIKNVNSFQDIEVLNNRPSIHLITSNDDKQLLQLKNMNHIVTENIVDNLSSHSEPSKSVILENVYSKTNHSEGDLVHLENESIDDETVSIEGDDFIEEYISNDEINEFINNETLNDKTLKFQNEKINQETIKEIDEANDEIKKGEHINIETENTVSNVQNEIRNDEIIDFNKQSISENKLQRYLISNSQNELLQELQIEMVIPLDTESKSMYSSTIGNEYLIENIKNNDTHLLYEQYDLDKKLDHLEEASSTHSIVQQPINQKTQANDVPNNYTSELNNFNEIDEESKFLEESNTQIIIDDNINIQNISLDKNHKIIINKNTISTHSKHQKRNDTEKKSKSQPKKGFSKEEQNFTKSKKISIFEQRYPKNEIIQAKCLLLSKLLSESNFDLEESLNEKQLSSTNAIIIKELISDLDPIYLYNYFNELKDFGFYEAGNIFLKRCNVWKRIIPEKINYSQFYRSFFDIFTLTSRPELIIDSQNGTTKKTTRQQSSGDNDNISLLKSLLIELENWNRNSNKEITENILYVHIENDKQEVFDIIANATIYTEDKIQWELNSQSNTLWNLYWSWSRPQVDRQKLLIWQKINHFSHAKFLTNKDLLKRSIDRFTRVPGRRREEFAIMPPTFSLPHEYIKLVETYSENESRPWIIKPIGQSRGRGIRIVTDLSRVDHNEHVVVQRYIENPLLLDGYKFDLRLYVLCTKFQPLEAFIYTDGFARFSSERFSLDQQSLKNMMIHLTNTAIQQKAMRGTQKILISELVSKLTDRGYDWNSIWSKITQLVIKSLICVEDAIAEPQNPSESTSFDLNSFEVFGYDILINDRQDCWLLEVNASPSMEKLDPIDKLKDEMIRDTLLILEPMYFDRFALKNIIERKLSNKGKRTYHHSVIDTQNELNDDLKAILHGKIPRSYGQLPSKLNETKYQLIAPSSLYDKFKKIAGRT